NAVRQATLSATGVTIELDDLSEILGSHAGLGADVDSQNLGASLREIAAAAGAAAELRAISEALRLAKGNKAEAARILKTAYKTLYLKLKRSGLGNSRS